MSQLFIPQTFHRIWVGNKPMPNEFVEYGNTWLKNHPNWDMILWTDKNMIPLKNQIYYDNAIDLAMKSDIARLEILYNFGGVYIDCDFECVKNIEPLMQNIEAFAASEEPGIVTNAIMGCVQGNANFKALVDDLPQSIIENINRPINYQTGPIYVTSKLKGKNDIVIYGAELFYPYLYNEKHRKNEKFPNAYAIHHWAGSWL